MEEFVPLEKKKRFIGGAERARYVSFPLKL